jgi:hypothetical protein
MWNEISHRVQNQQDENGCLGSIPMSFAVLVKAMHLPARKMHLLMDVHKRSILQETNISL